MSEKTSKLPTFSFLIEELESESQQYRKDSMTSSEDIVSLVRVYYLTSTNTKATTIGFKQFLSMVEGCNSLCDIQSTYLYRSKNQSEQSKNIILTPTDSHHLHVELFDLGLL
jgi:hypothetical protein